VQLLWLHAGGYALLRIAERTERELNVWNPRREGVYTGPAMSATGRTHRLALPRAALPPCACSLPFAWGLGSVLLSVSALSWQPVCPRLFCLGAATARQGKEASRAGRKVPLSSVFRVASADASQQRSHWTADCTVAPAH
jgi:hypothetical protein